MSEGQRLSFGQFLDSRLSVSIEWIRDYARSQQAYVDPEIDKEKCLHCLEDTSVSEVRLGLGPVATKAILTPGIRTAGTHPNL